MRKLWLIAGLGIGFVLGSKSGTGFYDALVAKGRALKSRPEVRDILDEVGSTAHDEAHRLANQAKERVTNVGHSDDDASRTETHATSIQGTNGITRVSRETEGASRH
jgi:hypothetical protein